MSQGRTLRIRDCRAYLVSHQRADQMFHEGKFPKPDKVDRIGAFVEAGDDRAMGRAGVVGHTALATVTASTTMLT